jgi:large subunit ribosomal protein L22
MEVKATTKYLRISPFKARDVAREIQGLPVSQALDILMFTPRKAAAMVGKTLKSAIANAENNHELAVDSLVIKEAVVGDGPALKRYKPRARGSAGPIKKRTSHIFITLTDEVALPEAKKTSGMTRKKKIAKRAAMAKGMEKAAAKKAVKEEAPAEEEAPEAAEEAVVEEAVVEEAAVEAVEEAPAAEEPAAEAEAAAEDETDAEADKK